MIDEEPQYGFTIVDKDIDKRKISKQSAADFKKVPEHDRVFLRPEPYIGSTERTKRKTTIYNFETEKLELTEITTPKGQCRTFIEVLSNGSDGIRESRETGIECGNMKILMTPFIISIENDGLPIPIEPHEEECHGDNVGTVADLIFGNLGAGSNLDDTAERNVSGANGLGAKLCNIFSSYFEVEVGDNIRGVHQKIIWIKNMKEKISSVCTPPYVRIKTTEIEKEQFLEKIQNLTPEENEEWNNKTKNEQENLFNFKWKLNGKKYTGPNFVKVTFRLDQRKFKESDELHYNYEDLQLYMKYIVGVSFSSKIKIKLNIVDFFEEDYSKMIDYRDINKFMKLLTNEKGKNVISYSWDKNDKSIENFTSKELPKRIANADVFPTVEMCLIDAPYAGFDMSFCNGIYNSKGGVHTNDGYRNHLDIFKKVMIDNKDLGFAKELIDKLTIAEIKKHSILIMNYSCKNPKWDSQEKDAITNPKPKININLNDMKDAKSWEMISAIYRTQSASKAPKNRSKRKANLNFRDANFKGKKGKRPIALPCEGNSAGGYVDEYIMAKPGGFDIYAKINLRGKIKNVSGLTPMQMDVKLKDGKENELTKFATIIGLEDEVDYTTPEGDARLHYKEAHVMVDADSDGSHILCLLINFFFRRYPSFLKAGKLSWVMTPVIRAVTKDEKEELIERFYNVEDYTQWALENPKIKHNAPYFKGLASASIAQAREDALQSPTPVLYFDDEADIYLNVAFSQERGSSEVRKQWITAYKSHVNEQIMEYKQEGIPVDNFIRITNLLNTKLIEYSLETLPRALPAVNDNLKHSQRQVLYYLLKTFNYGNKTSVTAKKLSVVANGASDMCNYHHGDLVPVIARMGHDYAGSNNLPYVTKKGMIGSRTHLGRDCGAGRYVTTDLNFWVHLLYKKEIIDLIPNVISEGDKVEHVDIPALLPMALINGPKGISTGWSTSLTNHHPVDIADFIIRFITGEKVFPLVPWYINFIGKVTLELKSGLHINQNSDIGDEDVPTTYTGLTCKTEGVYKILKEYEKDVTFEEKDDETGKITKVKRMTKCYDFEVFEVPINVDPNKLFLKISEKCLEVGQWKSTDADKPNFIFTGYYGSIEPIHIGMVSREGLTNINMVDTDGGPISFDNIYGVINTYCEYMDGLFEELKYKKLETLQKLELEIKMKIILVKKVLSNEWVFVELNRKTQEADLESFGIPYKLFKSIDGSFWNADGLEELEKDLDNIKKEIIEVDESNHLDPWVEYLLEFRKVITKRPEYKKLDHHKYDIVECDMEKLIKGEILAPYNIETRKIENKK